MRAVLLALPLAAACAMEPMTPAEAPAAPPLSGSTWMLERLGDAASPVPVSLSFVDGRLSGEGPCNRYMGGYEQTGAALDIGAVAATRRACPHLDIENRYFGALTDAAAVEVAGDTLVLRAADGAELMRLRRA